MTKALGIEIQDFYDNHYPENCYSEDIPDSYFDGSCGNFVLEPEKKYDLAEFGDIVGEDYDYCKSFQSVFLKWKKSKTTSTLIVEAPLDRLEEIKTALKQFGCKIS